MNNPNLDFQSIETEYLKARLFKLLSFLFIVVPVVGELSNYYFSRELSPSMASSAFIMIITALNYGYYRYSRSLARALVVTPAVQLLGYTWGLYFSGGAHAGHIVFLPVFAVVCGFLYGKRGVFWTAVYSIGYCVFLMVADRMGWIQSIKSPSASLVAFHMIEATSLAAIISIFIERARTQKEKQLHTLIQKV